MWKIKIREVTKPSLTSIRVAFVLFKDGANVVNDEVTFLPSELDTAADKEQFILDKISGKAKVYMATDVSSVGVDGMVDQEYEISFDENYKDVSIASVGVVAAKIAEISAQKLGGASEVTTG